MTPQQLKNSILQMAVQGKLVPQNPNDEPASILIERIRAEKEKLIKEKKIKKEKTSSFIFRGSDNLPYEKIGDEVRCIAEEVPFEIPDSWEWCNLQMVTEQIHYGFTASAELSGNAKLLRITDIQNNKVTWKDVPYCTIKEKDLSAYKLHNRDIMIARTGGTIGKTYIVRELNEEAVFASYLIRAIPTVFVNEEYLKFFMESPIYWNQLTQFSMGTGQPNVNGNSLKKLWVPLPPLSEQKRIVQKIEELLPHIETYAQTYNKLEALNKNFPEQLKKSILQYAVQGKLVPQDKNDEPASLLLQRIREEKTHLVKEGKIKKDKQESFIFRRDNSYYEKIGEIERCIDEEIPFDIPDSWEWVRLGSVYQHNTGKALNSSNTAGKLKEYITTSNVYWNLFQLDKLKKMYFKDSELEKCTIVKGDLLVCEGGDVGRAAIWQNDYSICIQNHIHRLRAYMPICNIFFLYVLYLYKQTGLIGGQGIGIKGLSSNVIHMQLLPFPPISEQHKIVEKIENLLLSIGKL